ncbi:hypothetical protein EMIT0P258_100021 [Pseudomonas sp. IT-P258]
MLRVHIRRYPWLIPKRPSVRTRLNIRLVMSWVSIPTPRTLPILRSTRSGLPRHRGT